MPTSSAVAFSEKYSSALSIQKSIYAFSDAFSGDKTRNQEYTKSSAVMAVPSLQTRPGRNTKVQVFPSSDTFHRSAKAGCGTLSLSRRVRPSKIWSSAILSGKEVVIAGSRSDGSASNAYTTAFSCHTLSSLHPTRTRAIRHIHSTTIRLIQPLLLHNDKL